MSPGFLTFTFGKLQQWAYSTGRSVNHEALFLQKKCFTVRTVKREAPGRIRPMRSVAESFKKFRSRSKLV